MARKRTKKITFTDVVVVAVLSVLLGMLSMIPEAKALAPNSVHARHDEVCRVLHSIARTKTQRLLAVEACRHEDPDAWMASFNIATCLVEHKHD